jgi:hypothetical protein
MEDHSSRVEQVKERTSELKVKVENEEKKNRRNLSQTTQRGIQDGD